MTWTIRCDNPNHFGGNYVKPDSVYSAYNDNHDARCIVIIKEIIK